MSEDEPVIMVLLQYLPAMDGEPFIVRTQELLVVRILLQAALAAPEMRDAQAQVRVQPREAPLHEGVAEDALHELVAAITGAQTITVADQEFLSVPFPRHFFAVEDHAGLLGHV